MRRGPHFEAAMDAHMEVDAALTAFMVDPRPHHRLAVVTAAKRIISEIMQEAAEELRAKGVRR